jgi:hypothetical protein
MSISPAVRHLHNDLTRLRKARKEGDNDHRDLRHDSKTLAKDRKELGRDQKALKTDRKQVERDDKVLTRHIGARDAALTDLDQQKQAVSDQLAADTFDHDAVTPGVQQDPALLQQLADLTAKRDATATRFDTKIQGDRDLKAKDVAGVKQDRVEIGQDRKAIKHEKKVVKHDHFEIKHDRAVIKRDRHQALKDLQPAEYKMGLKGTNRARKELGLHSVSSVIRPDNAPATAEMKRLASASVSRAIARAMGISVSGNGNQIDNNLPRSQFKQVHMSLAEALKIPGMVLTWEHTSTTLGAKFGHTAITAGDGHTSSSDFIENNTLAGAASRTGLKIFRPI